MSDTLAASSPSLSRPFAGIKADLRRLLLFSHADHAVCQWFDPVQVDCLPERHEIVLIMPHDLFAAWIAPELIHALIRAVRSLCGEDWNLRLTGPAGSVLAGDHHLPDLPTNRVSPPPVSAAAPDALVIEGDPLSLNLAGWGEYSFASYLVNAKNRFPLAVLQEAAQGRTAYNPLILHGDVGTGKTHLARALGNALSAGPDDATLFCGPVDNLAALQNTAGAQTCHGLMHYRTFIVDDVQRVHLFPRLSDDLPLIIDHCVEHGKLFMCTTTLAPAEWNRLPQRLCARLEQGLVMLLHEADMDIRLRYALMQSRTLHLNLRREQVLTLAQQCPSLRRLIGVLQRLAALHSLLDRDISAADMERMLAHSDTGVLTAQHIIAVVSARCDVRPDDITGQKRQPQVVRARHLALYLCRTLLGSSYPALGRLFGGRDHSTIMHSCKKIQSLWESDKDTHNLITELSLTCRQRHG